MKKLLEHLKKDLKHYIDPSHTPPEEKARLKRIDRQLTTALENQRPIHLITDKGALTGTITRYDSAKAQLVLRDFTQGPTHLIALSDIQKISFLPDSVIDSQEEAKKD
ncbi:hypothetical protein [Streptococcus sp. DD12]|uniref:hypothetical protein n=1 Tax=Streptococcus sp. DD12 TaxID=1777880 RepID=UPI0007941D74|nr:hypothetical protein [Streptococcus sp. DD12]KXT75787.1 hypothetical protein STRDD12_00899 [Streptococcus sp. DD12]